MITNFFSILHKCFVDLRSVSILMTVWLIIVILIMIELGIFSNNDFVAFGPRKELSFMKVPIDTYYKYNILIVMIILHTFITDFIADSLSPHVLNIVQDPKTKFIPHKPILYYCITTIWALYCSITQLFVVFIAFAQLDLLLVRFMSDVLANSVTTTLYLKNKEYNPIQFKLVEIREKARNNHFHQQLSEETECSKNIELTDLRQGREDDLQENLNVIWNEKEIPLNPLKKSKQSAGDFSLETKAQDLGQNAKDSDKLLPI